MYNRFYTKSNDFIYIKFRSNILFLEFLFINTDAGDVKAESSSEISWRRAYLDSDLMN